MTALSVTHTLPARYNAERERMKREMEKLAEALRNGDKAAAEAAMDAIKDSAAKQRIYAKALALKATDPKIKKRLLDAALDMQDAVVGVLDAARAALNGTSTVEAAERAMAPFIAKCGGCMLVSFLCILIMKRRYDEAANSIAATFGGAQINSAPPPGGRDGLDGAAAEMQDLVRNLVVDKTAEGQLFGIAKTLAEAMAALSVRCALVVSHACGADARRRRPSRATRRRSFYARAGSPSWWARCSSRRRRRRRAARTAGWPRRCWCTRRRQRTLPRSSRSSRR